MPGGAASESTRGGPPADGLYFQSAIESLGGALILTDLDANITYLNRRTEHLLGFGSAELMGTPIRRFIPAGHAADGAHAGEGPAPTDGSQRYDVEAERKVGAPVWLEVHTTPMWDPAGNRIGFAYTLIDISDRKHLEAQLRQSQKMEAVGRLAGGVAHDLNNLLTVIQGSTHCLRSELVLTEATTEYLGQIERVTERSADLVRQLLAFSRKQSLRPKVMSINSIVTRADELFRRLIPADIQIRTRLDPRLGPATVDPGQIEQVLVNLVVNARDAIADGGVITLTTRNRQWTERHRKRYPFVPTGAYISLVVQDNGSGMDAETTRQIFEPFFTTKAPDRGTGLGLSVVYGIIKQSGGFILVESQKGAGTKFEVLLPRVDVPVQPSGDVAPPRRVAAPRDEVVLVVEDNDPVRRLMANLLSGMGIQVLDAPNGVAALEVYRAQDRPIDLLLTDVVMPEMGGMALATELRRLQPGVRVVYTSGYAREILAENGQIDDQGAFLQKPFSPEHLAQVLEEVLTRA